MGRKSYAFPVYSGLLTDGHRERMGQAVWEYLWCLDKITREYVDEAGIRWGIVLGGKPVKLATIAEDLKIHRVSCQRDLETLRKENYVRVKRTPHGFVLEVRNSKKFKKSCNTSDTSEEQERCNKNDTSRSGVRCIKNAASLDRPRLASDVTKMIPPCNKNDTSQGLRCNKNDTSRSDLSLIDLSMTLQNIGDTPVSVSPGKPKKKTARIKVPKQTDSRIKTLIDYHFDNFKKRYPGKKYRVVKGKDGEAFKDLLETFTLEELKEADDEYLKSNDKFIISRGFSIGIMAMMINGLHIAKDQRGPKSWAVLREMARELKEAKPNDT